MFSKAWILLYTKQCRLVKNLNLKDTFRLVYNREDFSFLIRVNPRYLHPRHPRTIFNFAKLNGIDTLSEFRE